MRNRMTLAQWSKKYKINAPVFESVAAPKAPEHNARYVIGSYSGMVAWDLFHLSDYVVSTVTGGTYWLAKRSN